MTLVSEYLLMLRTGHVERVEDFRQHHAGRYENQTQTFLWSEN